MERPVVPEATTAGRSGSAARLPLLIIVIGVLLLTTLILIPHILNPSTLLFSPSPSTVFVFVFHSSTLYTYTSTVYGIYYAAHYIL